MPFNFYLNSDGSIEVKDSGGEGGQVLIIVVALSVVTWFFKGLHIMTNLVENFFNVFKSLVSLRGRHNKEGVEMVIERFARSGLLILLAKRKGKDCGGDNGCWDYMLLESTASELDVSLYLGFRNVNKEFKVPIL